MICLPPEIIDLISLYLNNRDWLYTQLSHSFFHLTSSKDIARRIDNYEKQKIMKRGKINLMGRRMSSAYRVFFNDPHISIDEYGRLMDPRKIHASYIGYADSDSDSFFVNTPGFSDVGIMPCGSVNYVKEKDLNILRKYLNPNERKKNEYKNINLKIGKHKRKFR